MLVVLFVPMNTYRYNRSDSLKCGVLVTIITLLESSDETLYIIVTLEGHYFRKVPLDYRNQNLYHHSQKILKKY